MEHQISVIMCTYNPDFQKMKLSVKRIIEQKNIDLELIITDDGSEKDFFAEIKDYLKKSNFHNYLLIKNKVNVGTVKNYYGAIIRAHGEYVFGTSPGDYIYDDSALSKWHKFAEEHHAKISFGNGVYYIPGKQITLARGLFNDPQNVICFSDDSTVRNQKSAFFFGNFILGTTFLRERETAVKYIGKLVDVCKYVEDNTSMMFYFADGNKVLHYDNYVVWYEYGTGVSTSKKTVWEQRLKKDFDNAYSLLFKENLNDGIILFADILRRKMNKLEKAITLFVHFPILFLKFLKLRSCKKRMVNEAPVDMSKFPKFDKE